MVDISVIIPVYNSEKYLKRCLDSILNQTYQSFEIICVNDCSTDNCQKILEEYAQKYPDKFKILVNEVNMKAGRSKDKAIKFAEGEYIVYIDSDDYIKKDYLETYINAIRKQNVDIVVGGYIKDIEGKFISHPVTNSVWSIATYVIACSKMYKKAFIVNSGMEFSENTCLEDMYFNLIGFCNKPSYYVLEDYQGYYYYYNSMSVTSTYDFRKNHEEQTIKAFDNLMNKCDISKLDKDDYWVLQYVYIANIVNSLITYNRKSGIRNMSKKYQVCKADLVVRFPDYRDNPYIGIFTPEGQTAKIRLGVGVTMLLEKIGLDKVLFLTGSLI